MGSGHQSPVMTTTADRVTLSYPGDLSDWGRWQLDERSFQAYLRRVHEEAGEGDLWDVFLDVGCCGDSMDLQLRVEAVEGGGRLGEDTEFDYVEREACGVGGWSVQSEGGPTGDGETPAGEDPADERPAAGR